MLSQKTLTLRRRRKKKVGKTLLLRKSFPKRVDFNWCEEKERENGKKITCLSALLTIRVAGVNHLQKWGVDDVENF